MILGLTDISNGEVSVFNQNIKGNEKKIYPRISAIIETPGFYPNLTGKYDEIFEAIEAGNDNGLEAIIKQLIEDYEEEEE